MPELTRRERQVLERVCEGLSTKGIAGELGVSEQAVKAHISRLFLKHGVENRAGLVAVAVGGAERGRLARERDSRAEDLELQIEQLTARNTELEHANRDLRRSRASGARPPGASGATAAD